MKVLLVDDHILFREGLKSLLSRLDDIDIVETAETVSEAVAQAVQSAPDLILMNFNLPDGTGLEATQAILANRPKTNILFLTTYEKDERLSEALRFGALGYLNKSVSLNKLLAYIRSVIVDRDEVVMPIF